MARLRGEVDSGPACDMGLLTAALFLLGLGLVMVGSASMAIAQDQTGEALYYFYRQLAYVSLGLILAAIVWRIPLDVWEENGAWLFFAGLVGLMLVLVPALNREVNGSARWLTLAGFSIQPSEFAKLFVVIYLAGYLLRRGEEVRTRVWGFLKPMFLLCLISALLLLEPDFGTAVVLFATAMGMMFLGGVRLSQFAVFMGLLMGAAASLALYSPYRLARLTAFLNPWADPYNSGFQLTQALIAFGRGEWLGVGLGASVQKLFYLPEAHTDFVFAVLAEELGLIGALLVVAVYAFVVWRGFTIARRAEALGVMFARHLAYGLALWFAIQAFINLGVNMGVLPTKGLTLPLMSYGGTSMLVSCIAVALLLRADREVREAERSAPVIKGELS